MKAKTAVTQSESDEAMNLRPIEYRTPHPFKQTLAAIILAIENAGMTIFAEIDHAKAARDIGLSMPETRVIVYGNPVGGTPIMIGSPLSALELPLRVLVRELPGNGSSVAYKPIAEVLESLGVPGISAIKLETAQAQVANAVERVRFAPGTAGSTRSTSQTPW